MTVLTDNLPLLAGAPNGIKKLRELILELAVRGKLVPQDPSDEPASELLRSIAKEKARLVESGEIRRQKKPGEVGNEDAPFELPDGWEWAPISAVGHDWGQKTPDGKFTYIDVGSVDNLAGSISSPQVLSSEDAPSRARKIVKPGTVLYSTIRPYLLNIAVIEQEYEPESIASTAFAIVHPLCDMPSRYFLWYFRSPTFVRYVESVQMGIAYPAINDGQFFRGLCPIPPVVEQHRIVAKVDELMALCDTLETHQANAESAHAQLVQALLDSLTQASDANDFAASWQRLSGNFDTLFTTEASIDALKQTVLHLAVMGKLVPQDPDDEPASELLKRIDGQKLRLVAANGARKQKLLPPDVLHDPPFDVHEGWAWRIIDDVVLVTGGLTLGRKTANQELVSKPYLRVANVQRWHLNLTLVKNIEIPADEINKYLLQDGDLLITEGGDWDKVGRTAIWRNELPECLHQNHVFRARGIGSDWEPRWAEMYLNSMPARVYFAGSSKQTTNLASINMTQLRACPFPVPPIQEQHRIVAKVDELMSLCDQLKSRIRQARELNQQLAGTLVERAVA